MSLASKSEKPGIDFHIVILLKQFSKCLEPQHDERLAMILAEGCEVCPLKCLGEELLFIEATCSFHVSMTSVSFGFVSLLRRDLISSGVILDMSFCAVAIIAGLSFIIFIEINIVSGH